MTISKKVLATSVAAILLVVTVLSVFLYSAVRGEAEYSNTVRRNYERSVNDLAAHTQNIQVALSKGMYATTPVQITELAAKLLSESTSAKNALTTLPIEDTGLTGIYDFLSQVGDYSMFLAKKKVSGLDITEEEWAALADLEAYARLLSSDINELQTQLLNGTTSVYNIVTTLSESDSPTVIDGFIGVEEAFTSYPTLIYDGPFSDHLYSRTPLFTENMEPVTVQEAQKIAADWLKMDSEYLEHSGGEQSKMPTFNFKTDEFDMAVTTGGGLICYFLSSRNVETPILSVKEAVLKAEERAKELDDYELMTTYYEVKSNTVIVNFATVQDGVICYTDLVKIGIAMDNGEVMSYDARSYIMNHHDRTFPTDIMSPEELLVVVGDNLTVLESRLCIIPSGGENEIFCYEFVCENEGGQRVLKYINAENGIEEKILIVFSTESGTFTM